MVSYIDSYKKKMKRMGANSYERNLKNKSREFEIYFDKALNKESCIIDGKETKAIFQDHSQSNNKDLSDDKYVILPNDVECSIGSHVTMREQEWLVFTEEFKTIPTHQQLKIKIVNERIKWIKDGDICNKGTGWGAYVQNQTLYTLGVSTAGNHISVINAKMMLYMQNNAETRKLGIADRIFIGTNVYAIMFADTVSRKGLINFLLEEDTIGTDDNRELKIANYYSKINKKDKPKEDKPREVINYEIKGDDSVKVGKTIVLTLGEDVKAEEWLVENTESITVATIMERNDTSITLKISNDNRLVGKTFTVMCKVKDKGYTSKPVRITKKF